MRSYLNNWKKWFGNLSKRTKIIMVVVLFLFIGWGGYSLLHQSSNQPQYQTAQVEKGTLITSVSASGTVSQGNRIAINSTATGIVKEVYVKNGDTVAAGDKIADITLDSNSQQKQAAAYASYLSAQNNLAQSQAQINSLQAAEFKANQAFMNDAVFRNLPTTDPIYVQEDALWLQAEADYKNQTAVIAQAQAALDSSWLSYSQLSSSVTAPIAGVVSGLTITPGMQLSSNTSSTTTTTTPNTLGTITLDNSSLMANVNLTEVDVTKVKVGQKVTLTLDAFPDKTFTGKVSAIDTNGSISSNVTTYPTTITFDSSSDTIYPNMAVTAKIITNIEPDVLLVPSAAVTITNGESTVRVMKNNTVTPVTVEVGDSNDTQTVVTSGVAEGDSVVIGTTATTRTSAGGTSPFSGTRGGFGGGGLGGGGNAVFRAGGGAGR